MKKIISVVLTIIMLTTLLSINAFAETEQNLCSTFNSTVGYVVSGYIGTDIDCMSDYEKVPVGYLFCLFIQETMEKDGSLEQYKIEGVDEYSTTYKIPFAVFEAKAKSIADYSGDLKSEEFYDSETDCMVFRGSPSPIDQGHPAFVIGYNDNGNNNYTVYIQRMQLGFDTIEEVEAEFGDYYSDYNKDKDIFQDYDGLYHLVHRDIFYKADITYINGKVFYKSVKDMDSIDGITMITRDTVLPVDTSVNVAKDGCSVSAESGVFPAGTEVNIQKLTTGGNLTIVNKAMADIADKFMAFEISATKQNTTIQPNGKVTATFDIPSEYDTGNLAVYYVANGGTTQKLDSVIDKTAKTIIIELTHFSTYVVAQTKTAASTGTRPGDNSNVLLYISFVLISGMAIAVLGGIGKRNKAK